MRNFTLIVSLILLLTYGIRSQTLGTLTVTTTTSNAGGNYAPRNIVAIWIEDEQGNWVKTLLAYAATRKTHLNTWEASTTAAGSPFNVADAITGATRNSHDVRTCTWNATNINGTVVPDGVYKVRMELTDKNATGNFSTFTFTKGPQGVTHTPSNVPSFSSISINWEPNTISTEDNLIDLVNIYPNPAAGIFRITGAGIIEVQVWSSSGILVKESRDSIINLSGCAEGIYYARIKTDRGFTTRKLIVQK